MRRTREPAYGEDPGEPINPILLELGMDLRMYLRIDLRQFLRVNGVDPQSGEPTPEELQAYLIHDLLRFLRGLPYVVDADLRWIDDAIQ
jgi:hypothetical protein